MDQTPTIFGREPVLWLALVQAVIGLLAAYGLNFSGEQMGATMALTAALLAFAARSKVTPV